MKTSKRYAIAIVPNKSNTATAEDTDPDLARSSLFQSKPRLSNSRQVTIVKPRLLSETDVSVNSSSAGCLAIEQKNRLIGLFQSFEVPRGKHLLGCLTRLAQAWDQAL
jgi:hypothetical protein